MWILRAACRSYTPRMLELTRTIRFCVNDTPDPPGPRDNTYAAWPAMRGLGRYYELSVRCRGEADPQTGYFINIKHIDEAVRDHALPVIERAVHNTDSPSDQTAMGALMRRLTDTLQPPLDQTVHAVTLGLTPFLSLTIRTPDMSRVTIRHQYEFSAAHRLHVPELSDAENRNIFGKCNNPAGHGHNYRVEVAIDVPVDERGRLASAEQIDALVDTHAIQKLDHKHLNRDVPEFDGVNPSVEHIVQVVYHMLQQPVEQIGAELREVTVWETGKTSCTYAGPMRTDMSIAAE